MQWRNWKNSLDTSINTRPEKKKEKRININQENLSVLLKTNKTSQRDTKPTKASADKNIEKDTIANLNEEIDIKAKNNANDELVSKTIKYKVLYLQRLKC